MNGEVEVEKIASFKRERERKRVGRRRLRRRRLDECKSAESESERSIYTERATIITTKVTLALTNIQMEKSLSLSFFLFLLSHS